MQTDNIFKTRQVRSSDFKDDASVVNVFDDMVVRSVPFYLEFQRMITEIARDYAVPNTSLYDLGCSTGTTMLSLNKVLNPSIRFVGLDNSTEMLEVCRTNFLNENFERPFDLLNRDLNRPFEIENASVVILCLSLQFIRPVYRFKLLQSVYEQLNPGACLILVEKVLAEEPNFNKVMIKYYYDFKRRNNYDDMEISQKREALENILIPYKLSENVEMLMEARFNSIETFFKWYNFAGIVAFKSL
jgi:tRNA (cmo5U34)-methyltransferase